MIENNAVPQKVTIDDLALMVGKGFKEMDEQFALIDKRFASIEQNMATKDDIHRLEMRFDSLEKTVFNDHGRRLRKIETKLQIA